MASSTLNVLRLYRSLLRKLNTKNLVRSRYDTPVQQDQVVAWKKELRSLFEDQGTLEVPIARRISAADNYLSLRNSIELQQVSIHSFCCFKLSLFTICVS